MKIGTDGVLLGAWTPVDQNPFAVLDIGTGTGVIALMLAQRYNAEVIDALELDEDAYEQAVDNFEASPWGDRLFCYHAHLYEFATEIEDTYDLIVCNPPYFEGSTQLEEQQGSAREQARFEDAMPFELLVASVNQLLEETGIFCVIIPRVREEEFISLAAKANLYPLQITNVQGNPEVPAKRSLISFSRNSKASVQKETLIIETGRHQYTDAYQNLVKDFYLKM
ncbi:MULTISPECIES: methyltransferase [unclassified Leeuwenhoekiella]|uniref:tRNA1(Val) (adenine(37)-N6)-methyltransferase n=1 Tax=unclassified Leeuwenhoekiella TaxID=2615029 RepID=UPI000C485EBA|nr:MULTISPECIES: methyltransferase [unclassified Leeuwenhoekiella]MAW94248.1 tRNA (adenine-N(6)-)-methyltransferase [Leeuwenhoekiella sp.]MAW96838.1 tRNA (adenine-N(6)-)-methyltransferase [Leeuwenhoekiella sp.]MBA80336.1 tRNA (adenine-N(6)-)-methyltransferase [Leeuwenhoekiella sp.]